MLTVTPAKTADIPALCELLNELFMQEAEFNPDYAAQSRGLACIIDNPEVGSILVARRQGEIVGMVNLLYTVSTALGERVALLEDMVVAPAMRGSGIGSRLVEAAIGHARHSGCRRITLLTDQDNQRAQRFYGRHGFRASAMVPLRLMLGAE
ncbi:MAG: GNAT family N-acetyltransferase [Methylomonas sp.]